MGLFTKLDYSQGRPNYYGLPIEDIKSTNATLDSRYRLMKERENQLELMIDSLDVEDRNEFTKKQALTKVQENLKKVTETGAWEYAAPYVDKAVKEFATDPYVKNAVKSKQLMNANLKEIDDLEEAYMKGDKGGGLSPELAQIARMNIKKNNYNPINIDEFGNVSNMYTAEAPPKYVDKLSKATELIGKMQPDQIVTALKGAGYGYLSTDSIKGLSQDRIAKMLADYIVTDDATVAYDRYLTEGEQTLKLSKRDAKGNFLRDAQGNIVLNELGINDLANEGIKFDAQGNPLMVQHDGQGKPTFVVDDLVKSIIYNPDGSINQEGLRQVDKSLITGKRNAKLIDFGTNFAYQQVDRKHLKDFQAEQARKKALIDYEWQLNNPVQEEQWTNAEPVTSGGNTITRESLLNPTSGLITGAVSESSFDKDAVSTGKEQKKYATFSQMLLDKETDAKYPGLKNLYNQVRKQSGKTEAELKALETSNPGYITSLENQAIANYNAAKSYQPKIQMWNADKANKVQDQYLGNIVKTGDKETAQVGLATLQTYVIRNADGTMSEPMSYDAFKKVMGKISDVDFIKGTRLRGNASVDNPFGANAVNGTYGGKSFYMVQSPEESKRNYSGQYSDMFKRKYDPKEIGIEKAHNMYVPSKGGTITVYSTPVIENGITRLKIEAVDSKGVRQPVPEEYFINEHNVYNPFNNSILDLNRNPNGQALNKVDKYSETKNHTGYSRYESETDYPE